MPHVTIARSAQEMVRLQCIWESLYQSGRSTIFQNFHWNLLAADVFAGREEPFVICVTASYGTAIVPAVLRHNDGSLRMLGDELFDYRGFLHCGEDAVLALALAELATRERPLEVVSLRGPDLNAALEGLPLLPFSAAPGVFHTGPGAEWFVAKHSRLARNLRRLVRLGFTMKNYHGDDSRMLRFIYQQKAAQEANSLFHDPLRVNFLIHAALLQSECFEVFTLECGSRIAAALVTLRDSNVRRFYTGWFDSSLAKFSPAMSLIYDVTRQSLVAGLDCDYMTGEQPYKMRLATKSVPLYRLCAAPHELAALPERHQYSPALIGD